MEKKKLKIGLVTTLNHNIGDDFIRDGIIILFDGLFGAGRINYVPINKHKPLTIFQNGLTTAFSKTTDIFLKNSPNLERTIHRQIGRFIPAFLKTRFDDCDAIIQCGTPVFWDGCSTSEWADIIWKTVIKNFQGQKPVLNIAAGSSYPWERQPASIRDIKDDAFIKDILSYCDLTTTRDMLANKITGFFGHETACLPCTAFLLAKKYPPTLSEKDLIIFNYMPGGGHFSYGQEIDPMSWENTVKEILSSFSKKHQVIFLCHNLEEQQAAMRLAPSLPRILPKTQSEYFAVASRGIAALCNRMHASVALAGLGTPSIAVGTDSRLLMVDRLSLPNFYVKGLSSKFLIDKLEKLISRRKSEEERLISLKNEVVKAYTDLFSSVLSSLI